MQVNAFTPKIIFAANTHLNDADELATVAQVVAGNVTPAQGCYKGETERSYVIAAADAKRPEFYEFLANNNQESILFLDNQHNGFLYFKEDGYKHGPKTQYLGQWREATHPLLQRVDAYTVVNGRSYVCC